MGDCTRTVRTSRRAKRTSRRGAALKLPQAVPRCQPPTGVSRAAGVPSTWPGTPPQPGARSRASRTPSGAWTTRRSRASAVSAAVFAASSRCGICSDPCNPRARSAAMRPGGPAVFPESGLERRGAEPVADPEVRERHRGACAWKRRRRVEREFCKPPSGFGVGPRPSDHRCRSAFSGRGRERPTPSVSPVRRRGGSACACPFRPPWRVAPVPIVPTRRGFRR